MGLQGAEMADTRTDDEYAAAGVPASALAQYAIALQDDREEGKVHYFGSAKDEKGALLEDVTFVLETEWAKFIFVTDANGRFRGVLPVEIPVNSVKASCSKPGFQDTRVVKRPGPRSADRAGRLPASSRRQLTLPLAQRPAALHLVCPLLSKVPSYRPLLWLENWCPRTFWIDSPSS